ncbi:MAG: YciI family protein [Candidatus Limnocylindrales bacterium]
MRYALLIYTPEVDPAAAPEGMNGDTAEYAALSSETSARGILRAGDALQPSGTATVVRVRDGRTLLTDGPFAETKEQLGGFYVFDCRDLDEALELAARIPGARHGAVEVRPIWELPADMAATATPASAGRAD